MEHTVPSILQNQSALIVFIKVILICYSNSKLEEETNEGTGSKLSLQETDKHFQKIFYGGFLL
jgi:hypothetical protein